MKKFFLAFLFFTAFIAQLKSQDYATISKEYCDCFMKLKDTMDTQFRELMIRVAKQDDIKAAFITEMNALDVAKQSRFAQQLEALGTSMDSDKTEAGRCGIRLDDKYEQYIATPEKEKNFTINLAAEFKKNKNCEFIWAMTVFALSFGDED